MLRGIFSGHVGTKDITRLALEAEERSDYLTAQQLYKEVSMSLSVHTAIPFNALGTYQLDYKCQLNTHCL